MGKLIQYVALLAAILAFGWGYYEKEVSPAPVQKAKLLREREKAAFLSTDDSPLFQLRKADPMPAIEPLKAEESGKQELFELPKKESFPF